MGRMYTVPFELGTVTNAGGNVDLWELLPADDKPIKLRGLRFGQTSEVGDAAEEGWDVEIIRMTATITGGNGSAVTPVPSDSADAAAGFTAEVNGATVATTSGSTISVDNIAWNNRNSPYETWWPDGEFAPKAKQGEGLFVRLNNTLVDDTSFSGVAYVEEE